MKKLIKATLTGLFATALLVGCGSKEEPKKEETSKQESPKKEEAKKPAKEETVKPVKEEDSPEVKAEKIAIIKKHPILATNEGRTPTNLSDKERLELYDKTEKKAQAEGKSVEEYAVASAEKHEQEYQAKKAQEEQAKPKLTQDQCDTAKAEYEMMTKAINEGSNNRKNSTEYLKIQKKVESCKNAGMVE
ncbi:ABC transporter permease [Bacillus pseudomycoides]|uniref:ABC transporter permease n=1 Tax=Bacillus pseudomycoides TaxID=64104 RepID=UPI000BFC1317|nr:ABC transporter permease [Bacillus pseudomycoides]PHB23069.1 ABC transporter permease [Bacillus pseudomycoides]PHE37598.1 ABC transporter permease [Bacillus pseudomycoides]